jgi:PKD repeat protein
MAGVRDRLTYAGRPFRVAPETVRTLLARYRPEGPAGPRVPEAAGGPVPAPRLAKLGPAPAPAAPPRLNELSYPTGATRWAEFRGLMTSADLAAVEALCFAGGTAVPQPLVISAGGVSVETALHLLPPRPAAAPGPGSAGPTPPGLEDLYLVTLVDERYFWRGRPAGAVRPYGSWGELVDQLGDALGAAVAYEPVEDAYGWPEPDSGLYSSRESAAALLDAVAANLGRVVVREFSGLVRLVRWADANAAASAAGLDAAAGTRVAGGPSTPFLPASSSSRRAAVLPARVVVSFPRWVNGYGYETPSPLLGEELRGWDLESYHAAHAVVVEPADLGAPYAALPARGDAVALRTTAKARLDEAGGDPANADDLEALALRLARDHLDRLLGAADVTYPGVFAAGPGWGCDLWFSWPDGSPDRRPATRAARPPADPAPREFQHRLNPLVRVPWEARQVLVTGGPFAGGLYPGVVWAFDPYADVWQALDCLVRALPGETLYPLDGGLARLVDGQPDGGEGLPVYALVPARVRTGCGILFDPEGGFYYADTPALAGYCLTVDYSGDCPRLAVDPVCLASGGSLVIGCGLANAGGTLVVDNVALAGAAATTSIVPSGVCAVAVDLTPSSTTTETVIEDVGLVFSAGELCVVKTRVEYTNVFNAANLHIDRFESDRSTIDGGCVDPCLMTECCDADPLLVDSDADSSGGSTPPVTIHFTSTVSGGVEPYTYDWDFDDGSDHGTTAAVDHEYDDVGTYDVVLTVTDACGTVVAASTIVIEVTGGSNALCSTGGGDVNISVADSLYLHFSGCTGGLASLNGTTLGPLVYDGVKTWEAAPQAGFTTIKYEANSVSGGVVDVRSGGVTLAGCVDSTTGLSPTSCSPFGLENSTNPPGGTCVTTPGVDLMHYTVNETP